MFLTVRQYLSLDHVPLAYLPCDSIHQLLVLGHFIFLFLCSRKWGACDHFTLLVEWSLYLVAQWTMSILFCLLDVLLAHPITWEVTAKGLPLLLDSSARCHTSVWALERGLSIGELAPHAFWLLGSFLLFFLLPVGSVE